MVLHNGEKMSKSRGNVVGIDETAEKYGIDAMRLFLLYVTPPEETSDWTEKASADACACSTAFGAPASRTLPARRSTREAGRASAEGDKRSLRAVAIVAKSAIEETRSRRFHYNATIAKLDELVNAMTAAPVESTARSQAASALPLLIAPFAPHIAEELWERLGHSTSVHLERYPEPDPNALEVDEITLVVQVNGKVRARIVAPAGIEEEQALERALADANVRAHLEGKTLAKQVYVRDKLLSLVVM